MTNLVITDVCDMHCPFCFAEDYLQVMNQRGQQRFITQETFAQRLDWLSSSNMDEARLIGGEPTLHPDFPELVQMAVQRGFRLVVFSHGNISDTALAALLEVPADSCNVLINTNAVGRSETRTRLSQARRVDVIHQLGERVSLGFNIYTPDFDLQPVYELAEQTNCHSRIRLGMAQPIVGGDNQAIHPKQYAFIGERLLYFGAIAGERGLTLDLDCGFVRCMFPLHDLGELVAYNILYEPRCNPILDISLDDTVVHCFPLSNLDYAIIPAGDSVQPLRDQLAQRLSVFRDIGVYSECETCYFRQIGECAGGCLAASVRRFRQDEWSFSISDNVYSIHEGTES
jgi:MoaA/NifB/PqqE/SkfB family radical SAM enzyme